MFKKSLTSVAVTAAVFGMMGSAQAAYLSIISADPTGLHPEVTGDAGGTSFPHKQEVNNGSGVPSAVGGWPTAPGFAVDPTFQGIGTSGWHASYLQLNQAANVTFQYVGHGDASNWDIFQVFNNGQWQSLFTTRVDGISGPTPNCAAGPGPTDISCTSGGGYATQNQYTLAFDAGYIPFRYLADQFDQYSSQDIYTNGVDNPVDILGPNARGGFFLGCDPYLVAGPFTSSCNVVYAGLTDRHRETNDHDFQDLGVRISVVPEPGTLALLGLGLAGLAATRRRKK